VTSVWTRLDSSLLAAPRPIRALVLAATVLAMAWQALPNVPRAYLDFAGVPALAGIEQPDQFGTDTIGDGYEARAVLNDVSDMYTKMRLAQTPLEAATWTKGESAPYPPAMLLTEAALYRIGEWTGLQFYGVILALAVVFLVMSLVYFVRTRWYVFPLLYLNFGYLAKRLVYVQDCSYIVMLTVVVAALLLARSRMRIAHVLMAVAIAMKVAPLFFVTSLPAMPRRTAWIVAGVLVLGLLVPVFVWTNYGYIFLFHGAGKGDRWGLVAAVVYALPFAVALWYVDVKLRFDWETRIGWSLVPLGMFLALRMNAPRHLLVALLVPDKHAARNVVAAVALALPALLPDLFPPGSMLPISTVLLFAIVVSHLRRIGWRAVRDDLRQPRQLVSLLLERAAR